jgi:hypothetical protein
MAKERSSWAVGWALTAAALLFIAGAFQVMQGVVALFKKEFFVVTHKWVFTFNLTTWGWIHLIVGIIVILAAVLITAGNLLGRIIGIIVAIVSAVVNFAWLPYYPVWSVVIIALDIAIIWALALHGHDVVADR